MEQRQLHSVAALGQALRIARQERGLTQRELAARIGASREWVISVERGQRLGVEFSKLLDAFEALGVSLFAVDDAQRADGAAAGSPVDTRKPGPRPVELATREAMRRNLEARKALPTPAISAEQAARWGFDLWTLEFAPRSAESEAKKPQASGGQPPEIDMRASCTHNEDMDALGDTVATALGTLLRREVRQGLYEQLTRGVAEGVNESTYPVISALDRYGSSTTSELAERLGIHRSVASRHATTLEGFGLISRASSTSDRRSTALTLTPEGAQAVATMRQRLSHTIGEFLQNWPAAQARGFTEVFSNFAQLNRFKNN